MPLILLSLIFCSPKGRPYRGILSSTSTGHQPKISQVCTVSLKATHLPVRMPEVMDLVSPEAQGMPPNPNSKILQ